jgi:prepilin-type N-terminal cleavage/methylation domain-containing protein
VLVKERDGRGGAARRACAGFTLVEVVVTLGVLSIALGLAGRLLIESQLGLVRAATELANPMPRYALELLRLDLMQAEGVPMVMPVWRSSPLELTFPAGAPRVRWELSEEGDVERILLDDAGRAIVRHVALRGVANWRWRPVPTAPRLVDVELTYRARDTSRVPLADVARTWSPPTIDRVVWMRVGLRADENVP